MFQGVWLLDSAGVKEGVLTDYFTAALQPANMAYEGMAKLMEVEQVGLRRRRASSYCMHIKEGMAENDMNCLSIPTSMRIGNVDMALLSAEIETQI